jgi:hypothetical protein
MEKVLVRELPKPPLSNIQIELLKLYSVGVSDEILLEMKKLLSRFLMQKLREEAGKVWLEKGYTDATVSKWLDKEEEK